jgi:hypothetical protein
MKHLLPIIVGAWLLLAAPVQALTKADLAALHDLTSQYVSWDYSERPVEFRERLDYASYEE